MIRVALFGAGRIGAIHAANLALRADATLVAVVDPDRSAARKLARRIGAVVAAPDAVFADRTIDAVLICSSTDTHATLAIAAARAGKAIFCEKPIDLALPRVDACLAAVRRAGVPMMVGFNRRFDPSFRALQSRLAKGEIGRLEQLVITSRDPAPPPASYVKVSGGLFRDMAIHDFDMARWLLGEEPESIYATGSCLVDPAIGRAGDIDSAMMVLRTPSGRLCHINNSRRATYGYDQRIEAHGSEGRLIANNHAPTSVEHAGGKNVSTDLPLHFFLERYAEAYRAELDGFVAALNGKGEIPVGGEDGRRALVLADAAARSLKSGRPIRLHL
jgi:myo-inositol 2-dehydrogenase/D-chiro-inositol 1-dehydrogenase